MQTSRGAGAAPCSLVRKQSCVGGGFLWSLDLIRDSKKRTPNQGNGCDGAAPILAVNYIKAIKRGLGLQAAVADR